MRESEFKKRPGLVAFLKILNWPYTLSNNNFWVFYLVFSDREEPSCLRKFQLIFQSGVQMVNTIWYSIKNHFIFKLFYWQLVTNIYWDNLEISSNSLLKYYGFLNYNAKLPAAKPGKTAEPLQRHFGFPRESSSGAANNGRLLRTSKWQCRKTNKLNKY